MARTWLETAVGPDGDRVTFIIEPRLDRFFSAMDEFEGYEKVHAPFPSLGEILGRLSPGDRQQALVKNAWLVRIEADSGRKKVLKVATQSDAEERAASVAKQVRVNGSTALEDLG